MTETKPCKHCLKPIHRDGYRPNSWKLVKVHKHCLSAWKAKTFKQRYKKKPRPKKLKTYLDTSHINPYLSIPWTRAA